MPPLPPRFLRQCIYIYIHIYIYIYIIIIIIIIIYINKNTFLYIYLSIYICLSIFISVCLPAYLPICLSIVYIYFVIYSLFIHSERERNVLFNDALNTLYLRLYGVRYMVKDHSDSEKGNLLPPHRLLLSISSKGSFICTILQTG